MPYYVYKITQPTPMLKNLELLTTFEAYKDARTYTRDQRMTVPMDGGILFKLVHAATELGAEELLMEKRDKSIVMEWEK